MQQLRSCVGQEDQFDADWKQICFFPLNQLWVYFNELIYYEDSNKTENMSFEKMGRDSHPRCVFHYRAMRCHL